jgi:NDP-sugar pyrophosphorylase family protein
MKKAALVILAAGIGSRFGGGIKQLEPVGPNGEIIMDYSIHDAIEAGFSKVVFIIRRDLDEDFRRIIGDRISKVVEVAYAYQAMDDLPEGFSVPEGRKKPWGTGQAVLAARDVISEPFAVINADDYYGRSAFETLGKYLSSIDNDCTEHAMVGYILGNTMSRNGSVSRGVAQTKDGYLESIVENTKIYYTGEHFSGKDIVSDLNGKIIPMTGKETVSMNFFGFSPKAFERFEKYWDNFKANKLTEPKAEALLPEAASDIIKNGEGKLKVFTSDETWFGMTYPEDKQLVKDEIAKKISSGYYPERLWEK